jgi:hypoxanthine-DNA glycosylase
MERLFAGQIGLEYAARKALLIGARVALWDVLHAAKRCGSVDSNIVPGSEVVNDFPALFAQHPDIKTVFFNGGNAQELFHRLAVPQPDLRFVRLPSTSPANARMTRECKLEQWKAALREALNGNA